MKNKLIKIANDTNLFLEKFIKKQKKTELIPAMSYGLFPGGKKIRSKIILDIMVEQYEEASPLPNREPSESARAAAWIFIKAKDSEIKGITKKSLKSVPTVKSAELDRAIESYRDTIQKRIKPVEGVPLLDVD